MTAELQKQVKEAIEEVGKTNNERIKALDEKIEAVKSGGDVSAIEGRLEKMNDRFDELEDIKSTLEKIETKGNRIGKTDTDIAIDDHKKAFGGFLRKGEEGDLDSLQVKAISVGVDGDGGYAVPEDLDRSIEKYAADFNPMRGAVTVMTVSNEEYRKLVRRGGAGSGWVGETAARPETGTPTLEKLAPYFGELYANPAATQKSLDDVMFDVEGWLAEEVAEEFSSQENAAFTLGDGVNKPRGFLNYTMAAADDSARAFQAIQYRISGADASLGADAEAQVNNLIDLEYDLKSSYRNGAMWMLNRGVLRATRKVTDANGNKIWQPSMVAGQPSMLNGYGVIENEDMPDVAAGSNSLAFGNFKRAYVVLDVRGSRVLRDPYTHKPYVHFYTTKRVGSFLKNDQCIKVLRLSV